MRLWSLHPSLLDSKGLVAVWREGLLAQAVLHGRTKGYRHHPQLERFRPHLDSIGAYLEVVADEAERRGYNFDRNRIDPWLPTPAIDVTSGQLDFEFQHLRAKVLTRTGRDIQYSLVGGTVPHHPSFRVVNGPVAEWEKVGGPV